MKDPPQSNEKRLRMIPIHGPGPSGITLGDEESTQTVKGSGEQYHCGVEGPQTDARALESTRIREPGTSGFGLRVKGLADVWRRLRYTIGLGIIRAL